MTNSFDVHRKTTRKPLWKKIMKFSMFHRCVQTKFFDNTWKIQRAVTAETKSGALHVIVLEKLEKYVHLNHLDFLYV